MMQDSLINMLWEQSLYVTVAAIAVFTLIKLTRARDPRILLGLWGLVLLRFFLPLDLAMPWSAREQLHVVTTQWVGTKESLRAEAQKNQLPVQNSALQNSAVQNSAVQDVVTRMWLPPQSRAQTNLPAASGIDFSWHQALFLLWLSGAFTLAGLTVRQHMQLLALLRRARPATTTQITAQIDIWRARYGIRRAVTVLTGETAMSPFTYGLRHPVIYMPAALLGSLTPAERDAVFGHELAHVRGYDIVWLVAERLAQILFFFHPVAWVATRELARAREGCCDLRAVQAGNMSAGHYWSGVLLALRKSHVDAPMLAFAPALGPSAQTLKARIIAMKQAKPMTKAKGLGVVCGMALLALLILPMAKSERVIAHPGHDKPVRALAASTAEMPTPPAPPTPPQVPEPPAEISASVEADIAEAQSQADWAVASATERVELAQESARRIAAGDIGNMVVINNGKEVICSPGAANTKDYKCTRSIRGSDMEVLRREAEQELAYARRDLEETRREAAQDVLEARREGEQNAREAAQEARENAREAAEDARAAAREARTEAQAAVREAMQAKREALEHVAEARTHAREIEIQALEATLESLRDSANDLRNDHSRELESLSRSTKTTQLVNTGQIITSVIQGLETSARQVEQQLAEARARKR
jgi:beta-lactamase regulating signal transducer with metallopeptidase domain